MVTQADVAALRLGALPLTGAPSDFDPLLERIGDKRLVLLGEATHGTHEFYAARAVITKRLIAEKGFSAVAIEGDWPDSYRVHRFVSGPSADRDAAAALSGFRRFPTWMWRNAEVLEFVGWLRSFNEGRSGRTRAGFFGLDLYSLYASIEAVLAYLDREDPEAAKRARERYACFDHFRSDAEDYALRAGIGLSPSCEEAVASQLVELRGLALHALAVPGGRREEEIFSAEQNARVVKNAEQYYRNMFGGGVVSWNLRDRHMADTLEVLLAQLARRSGEARIVVWAHNSHVGDARATEMAHIGELNVGQLVRESHRDDAYLVGFSTFDGTVTAARGWDMPGQLRRVQPALPGSWEAIFHDVSPDPFLLFSDQGEATAALRESRLGRAIGVVYRPETERHSHYFESRIGEQFDAVLHFDRTQSIEPLEPSTTWMTGEVPETYPFAV
jgi:erythromycin esterase-like protein